VLILLPSVPADSAPPAVPPEQLDACRRGDRVALDAVFRAHAQTIARVLVRIVGPSVEIEDLLQETFAAAIPAFKAFRGEASIKTWLCRIAIHVAHQYLRRPRHRREVALEVAAGEARAITMSPEQRETARRLYDHLDAIDATKRIALVLYAIEEYTPDEIAVLMGASKAATRSRIFWARRTLMKRMRRDPFFTRGGAL
jgi:RNA polymerase sigma-70 factor (ECF subfamily)